MNSEEEIFEAAAALPEPERAANLEKACAGQPELRARIEALLRADEATGFMEPRGGGFQPPLVSDDNCQFRTSPAEQPGECIGRYRLLQQIGEGGFGTVWMAEQLEPVTRRVALKIIKAGMDTKEVIARFEAERQALAMMDHPNIARVLDAGATDKGRPFFVMELVKGIPITKFCDEQQFTTRQRLELFGDVCSAINHAHQKGVIHRDIKPSNVMVTLNADRPVVKVIDFGIAKATRGKLTDATLFTRFEQFIGTPAYMSPEQAAISGVDIDTRSDIYSLGVLLYELLTGRPPFDARTLVSAGYEEMRRIIREVEPARPSARLSTVIGDERTTLASARHVAPEKLNRMVEPDLDWIVMKAIEKDRTRRYETANGLALDIQRFLADEPVSAGPPTARYRFRKFARRNKTALRVAAGFAAGLITATIVSSWLAVRATKAEAVARQKASDESEARTEAEAARNEAQILSDFLRDTFSRPQAMREGPGLTVVQAMEDGLKKMKTQLAAEPLQRHKLQRQLAWLMYENGKTKEILPYIEESRDYYRATHPPDHIDTINVQRELATYYVALGRWEEAKDILEPVYQIAKPLFTPEHRHATATGLIMTHLASCYYGLGDKKKAREMREELLEFSLRRPIDVNPVNIIWAREALARSYFEEERWAEALKLREEALPYRYKTHSAANSKPLFTLLEELAQSYSSVGREPDAQRVRAEANDLRRLQDSASGAGDLEFRKAKQQIAKALEARQFDEAVQSSRELVKEIPQALVASGKVVAPEAWLANALLLSARSDLTLQNSEKALQAKREAEEIIARLSTRELSLGAGAAIVDLLMCYGHWKEAAVLSRPLYQSYSGNPYTAFRLGPLLIKTGQTEDWEKLCHELLLPLNSAKPEQLEPLLNSLAKTYRGHAFDVIARVICLRPPTDANLKWAIVLSDRAVKLTDDPNWHWYNFARSLAAYRAGNFSEAVAALEPKLKLPSLQKVTAVDAYAVLAMSKYQMKDADGARGALQAGEELLNRFWFSEKRISVDPSVLDWLMADILLREAKALLGTEK